MDKVNYYTYKYNFGWGQFINLLIGFGLIGSSMFLLIRFPIDNTMTIVASFVAAVGLTPILLTIHYLTRSLDYEVRINHDSGEVEVTKKGQAQVRKLKDVTSVDIQEQKSIGLYGFDFDFAKYTFVDGKYFVVTNMMTKDYYIPAGLQPKVRQTIFPIIWSGTNV
jgi:hypothetical protein